MQALGFANEAQKLQQNGDGPCLGFCRDQVGTKTQYHLAFSQTPGRLHPPLGTHVWNSLCSFMGIYGSSCIRWPLSLKHVSSFEPSVWNIYLWFL